MEESISIARVATSPFCPSRAPERFHQGRAMLLIGFAGIGFIRDRVHDVSKEEEPFRRCSRELRRQAEFSHCPQFQRRNNYLELGSSSK